MAGAGGGAPPDYLGADDQRRVADVRRSVWTGGFQGLAFGLCFGSAGFLLGSRLGALPQPARAPKYWLLATMGLGALGSYVGALSAGRNSVQQIGDILEKGRQAEVVLGRDELKLSSYQAREIARARPRQTRDRAPDARCARERSSPPSPFLSPT